MRLRARWVVAVAVGFSLVILLLFRSPTIILTPKQETPKMDDVFWIAMTSWNDASGLKRGIHSVCSQDPSYEHIELVIFQDDSDAVLQPTEKQALTDRYGPFHCHLTFLPVPKTQLGSAGAKWEIFNYIRVHCRPDDYVLVLDGDDVFSNQYALQKVRRTLYQKKPWFAWGRIHGKFHEQCGKLPTSTAQFRNYIKTDSTTGRRNTWPICHPRMFKGALLHTLKKSLFQLANGDYLQKSTDRPFIIRFVELSGDLRIHFFDGAPLVNYSFTSNNGLTRFPKEKIELDKEYANNQKSVSVLPETIVVVSCVFDRSNIVEFLQHLLASELAPNTLLEVHICNNAPSRQMELTAYAKVATRQSGANPSMHVTIHDMDTNTYGFGRFVLAKQLMEKQLLDYFVMIDDDEYLAPDQLQAIYDLRQPQTYKCWYGKNWNDGNHNYWSPDETWETRTPRVGTWQYGGTGLSILDASVLRVPMFFDGRADFYDVEDMWLSFIVHRLGWTIERIRMKKVTMSDEAKTGLFSNLNKRKQNVFEQLGYLKPCTAIRIHGIFSCLPFGNVLVASGPGTREIVHSII